MTIQHLLTQHGAVTFQHLLTQHALVTCQHLLTEIANQMLLALSAQGMV